MQIYGLHHCGGNLNELQRSNVNREDSFFLRKSWKPLICSLKYRRKLLWYRFVKMGSPWGCVCLCTFSLLGTLSEHSATLKPFFPSSPPTTILILTYFLILYCLPVTYMHDSSFTQFCAHPYTYCHLSPVVLVLHKLSL